jgi:hypothetical protein
VLVVLASRHDRAACDFVARHGAGARLLSSRDLSARGWRYEPGGGVSRAVVGGDPVEVAEIEAVLTRLPSVTEADLGHIVAEDRAYVAAEMTAFLAAWLSDVACPVRNRPTPLCLMGPFWRPERWIRTASDLGLPVVPLERTVSEPLDTARLSPGRQTHTVTVIGRRCLPDDDRALATASAALARAAGVEMLRAHFTGPEAGSAFVEADYWVELSDPETADAVMEELGRTRAGAPSASRTTTAPRRAVNPVPEAIRS